MSIKWQSPAKWRMGASWRALPWRNGTPWRSNNPWRNWLTWQGLYSTRILDAIKRSIAAKAFRQDAVVKSNENSKSVFIRVKS